MADEQRQQESDERLALVERALRANPAIAEDDVPILARVGGFLARLAAAPSADFHPRDNHYEVECCVAPPLVDAAAAPADWLRRVHALGRTLRDEPLVSAELAAGSNGRALRLLARVKRASCCHPLPYVEGEGEGGGSSGAQNGCGGEASAEPPAWAPEDVAAIEQLGFVQVRPEFRPKVCAEQFEFQPKVYAEHPRTRHPSMAH